VSVSFLSKRSTYCGYHFYHPMHFLPLEGYCLDTNCPLIGNSNSIVWECNERSVEICLLKFDTIEILFIERAVR
jgi:hypothetical protein